MSSAKAGLTRRLQQGKHRVFVAAKPIRWKWYAATEPVVRWWHQLFPYRYDPEDFAGSFVRPERSEGRTTEERIARRVFVFWTGDNPLSENRSAALARMRAQQRDLDVILVTPEDLWRWEVPDHEFHRSYRHLSYVHRADYLRAYFLHHHGGCYADLKPPLGPWAPVLDRADTSTAWMVGYRVPVRLMTPNMPDAGLEALMRRCSDRRLGQCGYVARPRTPLTEEWLIEVEARLDGWAASLARCPGNARGDNPGYPVPFNALLAQVLDPLQIKYGDHLMFDHRLQPSHENYM